jgi:hypothetical protein
MFTRWSDRSEEGQGLFIRFLKQRSLAGAEPEERIVPIALRLFLIKAVNAVEPLFLKIKEEQESLPLVVRLAQQHLLRRRPESGAEVEPEFLLEGGGRGQGLFRRKMPEKLKRLLLQRRPRLDVG